MIVYLIMLLKNKINSVLCIPYKAFDYMGCKEQNNPLNFTKGKLYKMMSSLSSLKMKISKAIKKKLELPLRVLAEC